MVAILALIVLSGCIGSGDGDDPSPGTPSQPGGTASEVAVPEGWSTHAGEGFEVSFPADWEQTDVGQLAFNIMGSGDGVQPLASVEAVPAANVPAQERIEFFTAPIAAGTDSFEVVDDEEFSVPTASDGHLREVTYVGAGPSGEELEIHEYLVVVLGDGVDVHLRAAAPEELFADAAPTLRDIASTLVITPDTFLPAATPSPGAPSPT